MENKNLYAIRLLVAIIILSLSITAFAGIFYPIKFLNIEIIVLLQRIFVDFSIFAIILLVGLIILTLLFGRFFCSTLCPLGIFQELISFIAYKKNNEPTDNYIFKYIILGLVIGSLISGSTLTLKYIDPLTLFCSALSLKKTGIIAIILIAAIVFLKNRFFCTNICPVGTILGLISKNSLNKLYVNDNCIACGSCERDCPAGCINSSESKIDNEMCLKCLKCINTCPKNAIEYGTEHKKEIKFSLKRRNIIGSIAFLSAIGAGYALGINFAKKVSKKIQGIILPAGSKNAQRMQDTCLNCNLCINNCPTKILTKATKEFNAIHINFEEGFQYCKYNCNRCSEVCPSGAIKKISLEEKQKTKIAIATINNECTGCKDCEGKCPTDAIIFEENIARIDDSKCIGCGICKINCFHDAIEIFAVNEQSVI